MIRFNSYAVNRPIETNYSGSILDEPRPWAFSTAELTAGLRRFTGDHTLIIVEIKDQELPHRRPSVGRIRGLSVTCDSTSGSREFFLVLKEPQGATRVGMIGAGRREVSLYTNLADQIPIGIPKLLAAHPDGDWLVLNLLPGGCEPERWTANDYLEATDQLVVLHDRFWGLGSDLVVYPWLARPLDADLEIIKKAASISFQHLAEKSSTNILTRDSELLLVFNRMVQHTDKIAASLRSEPTTLLHGDYWPGNINVYADESQIVYDWQHTAIGPGILDLVKFIQTSHWWFDPLPLENIEIITRYRSGIAKASGYNWEDDTWSILWDYAFLWTFISNWIGLLETIPNPLLHTRFSQLEDLWLKPIRTIVSRRIPSE